MFYLSFFLLVHQENTNRSRTPYVGKKPWKKPTLGETQLIILSSIVILETLDLDPDFLHTKSAFLVILPEFGSSSSSSMMTWNFDLAS